MTTVMDDPSVRRPSPLGDHAPTADPMLRIIAEEVRVTDAHIHIAGYAHRLPAVEGPEAAHWVSHVLYHRYYHRHEDRDPSIDPFARRDAGMRRPLAALEDPVRGRALREALAGRYTWEGGWSVLGDESEPGGLAEVERDGLVLRVAPEELRRTPDGWAVRFPAQRPFASTGFFSVTGAAGAHGSHDGLVRCYLNLNADSACAAFAQLVRDLDRRGIPFSAKVANNDEGFDRPDSAVLYVERPYLGEARSAIGDIRRRRPDAFDAAVPAFTLAVAPGVGLADEPSQALGPLSFGQHRCALIADALVGARGHATCAQRLQHVIDAIVAAGLDPARLHLGAGSPDYGIEGIA